MSKHLLLADDSITIQKVVELTFSDSGYRVTCVSGGGQALAKVREDRPDIILCDVIMPEKNGYEVTEALKSSPATRAIPIILLSGTFEPFDEERAKKAGADGWVTKPFESQQLVALVEEHLQKRIMVGHDAPLASTQITGSSPSQGGLGGRAPNPSETVNMAPPPDLYGTYSSPPPPPASAFNTLPPPLNADPYAVPAFKPAPAVAGFSAAATSFMSAAEAAALPPVSADAYAVPAFKPAPADAPDHSNAATAAIPAVVIAESTASSHSVTPGIEERRQAVTQDMSQRSAEQAEALPAEADAGGPSIRATAPWAPLPPAAAPAPVIPEPEPDADFGAGTMQMMVGTGVKPWEQQPPAEAFAPPEIRPEQLLEETHRRGESAAAPAAVEAAEPLSRFTSPAPGYVPQAERPVSPTDSTETLPSLSAAPEAVSSWMTPAAVAPPEPAAPMAPVAEIPSWMSTAAATPEPAVEAVPSWMSPAPTPSVAPAAAAEPFAPADEATAPFLAPEIPEPVFAAPPPPPPPPIAESAPAPAWLAAVPPAPEPEAAPVPSWLTPSATPELPDSAELDAPPADAFATPQVRPNQLLEETKRRGTAPAAPELAPVPPVIPVADPEADSGAFSSAATMAVMSAALGGTLVSPAAETPKLPVRLTHPLAPVTPPPAPVATLEPELTPAAAAVQLSEAQIEAIARKMVEIFGDKILREVAWEVIPDMAEMLIKNRILELEGEAARESEKPAS